MLDTTLPTRSRRLAAAAVLALAVVLRLASPAFATISATDHSAAPLHIAEAFGLQAPPNGSDWDTADGVTADEIAGNIPGNVLFPGDTLRATFQIQNGSSAPLTGGTLEVRRYQLSTVGDNIFQYEIHNLGIVARTPITLSAAAGQTVRATCSVPIPAQFGGYALIADFGPQGGRHLVGLCVRTFQSTPVTQAYPVMTLDERDPSFLQRIGIHAIRIGIQYKPTSDPGFPAYLAQIEAHMADLKAHGITCMALLEGGSNYEALGFWSHQLNDQAQMVGGCNDTMWKPSYDADFTKFVATISAQEGWPRGPLTAVYLYNEPWEGGGISGWLDDMPRYREGYAAMAAGVLQARRDSHVQVLVGGTDSTSNALDKLFGDGKTTFLPIFDFVSMHYQGLDAYTTFPLWRDRKGPQGRVRSWDTESWAANTDDRVACQLAAWRAGGYDRVMGVDANATCEVHPVTLRHADGSPETNPDGSPKTVTVLQAGSVAAAEAATTHFLGDRPFRRILFTNGLPWVFIFDGLPRTDGRPNPEDGTVVICGDILTGNRSRFRTVDSLAGAARRAGLCRRLAALAPSAPEAERQVLRLALDAHDPVGDASLVLPAGGRYSLYDFYGNPQPVTHGAITVPLNTQGYFLRGDGRPGSFARLVAALHTARMVGLQPVEVAAHDMAAPLEAHPTLRFSITNVLNRPITGRLSAALAGCVLRPAVRTLSLGPNQTREVALIVAAGTTAPDNLYPLHASFDAGQDGAVSHDEVMHCNVIARRTITVDGDLSDWVGVLPQQVASGSTAPSLTEQAWYPNKNFSTAGGSGLAVAYLAYDSRYFYFAAKVADTTPDPGTLRFATRDDDAFFYPDTFYVPDGAGAFRTVHWPQGMRRYIYRKGPALPAGNGGGDTDNIQIGFNAIPEEDAAAKGMYPYPPGTMPHYIGFRDTDYEFALNQVAPQYGGGTEIWRLLTPGMPYKTFYPRQPKSPYDGAVDGGKLVIERVGNTRITEAAIPWSELAWVKKRLDLGRTVKFSFRVNDNNGPDYELAHDRSVSQENAETFHNPWVGNHWSNEVEFGFQK